MQDQTSFSDAKFCSSDVALSPVQGTSLSQISEEEVLKSNVWWKLDLAVLPVVTMIFFLSFLDRGNIANARVAGLQSQLGMTNEQYTMALTVTYIPYILVEIPSSLVFVRLGPKIMLPAMVTLWGIATVFQGFITSYRGLIACRFFVGLFEGGLLPGICLYLASFYPRQMLQLRISMFFAATLLAGAFSGLLAAAIIKMDGTGGKPGWSWIFFLEGAFTALFGVASFFMIPRTPLQAPFLNVAEKDYIMRVLQEDNMAADDEESGPFKWGEVWKTFKNPSLWLLAVVGFFNGSTFFGLAYFLPTIVSVLGYAGDRAQLMSVPPYAVAFVMFLVSSYFSDRYRQRGATILFFTILSTIGFAMFLGSDHPHVRYGSLFLLVPGAYCTAPPLGTWIANNSAPQMRRATAIALLTTMTNTGGILSTWLLGALSPPPRYTKASVTLLIFQVGILVFTSANIVLVVFRNREKRARRSALVTRAAELPGLGDESAWFEYTL